VHGLEMIVAGWVDYLFLVTVQDHAVPPW